MSHHTDQLPGVEPAGTGVAYHDVRLPHGEGFTIAVDTSGDDPLAQIYAQGVYPLDVVNSLMFALTRPGDAVLDLGSHIGTFSLAAAAVGCEVVAVEASPHNVRLLRASAGRNPHLRLNVVHAALSDRDGVLQFSPHGPYGHVYSPVANLPSVEVRALTVDRLIAELGNPRFRLVKLDIEGSEVACLKGMAGLLREAAPLLLYEGNGHALSFYGHTVDGLKGEVERHGYRNYLIRPGELIPVGPDDLQPAVVSDYLAVRGELSVPPGWTVAARQPLEETVRDILAAYEHPLAVQRLHLAALPGLGVGRHPNRPPGPGRPGTVARRPRPGGAGIGRLAAGRRRPPRTRMRDEDDHGL